MRTMTHISAPVLLATLAACTTEPAANTPNQGLNDTDFIESTGLILTIEVDGVIEDQRTALVYEGLTEIRADPSGACVGAWTYGAYEADGSRVPMAFSIPFDAKPQVGVSVTWSDSSAPALSANDIDYGVASATSATVEEWSDTRRVIRLDNADWCEGPGASRVCTGPTSQVWITVTTEGSVSRPVDEKCYNPDVVNHQVWQFTAGTDVCTLQGDDPC